MADNITNKTREKALKATNIEISPKDSYNKKLLSNVHPEDWVNPEPAPFYNLVVIGAGAAGLVTAAGATGLEAKVALIENKLMGGDCLNYGCVPSKTLIRSARAYYEVKNAHHYGIEVPDEVEINFSEVMKRVRETRTHISSNDSAERFKNLGVDVFIGQGTFSGKNTIEVNGKTLYFKKAVIATGTRPAELPVEGLTETGYLTNETLFNLTKLPEQLSIIGAGPVGCEMAQAFHNLGSNVNLIHRNNHILNRADKDAAQALQNIFIDEGINLILNSTIKKVEKIGKKKVIHLVANEKELEIKADEILVAVGRKPDTEGLNLKVANVEYDKFKGIKVNDYLQTTNPDIYAIGDVSMKHKFTHMADAAARIVIQNSLFFGSKRLSSLTVPWCIYTFPEIAHVGMNKKDAEKEGIEVDTFIRYFNEVDRAITDGNQEGFVKVHVKKGTDKILGATIVGNKAGDMISEITLAITNNIGLGKIAETIHPYPTHAEAIKQVADAYNRTRVTPIVRKMLKFLLEDRKN